MPFLSLIHYSHSPRIYEGRPKNNENFFLKGLHFRLLPLGVCMWLPSATVGQAASLSNGI